MDVFDSPFLTILLILLSLISFVLTWSGIKSRNLPWALYGIGAGVPAMGLRHVGYWVVGGLFVGLGRWVSRRY